MPHYEIYESDSELMVAVKLRRRELAERDELFERLLDERFQLLRVLAPFVRAGKELSEQQKYRPREKCYGSTESNRVICSMGHVDLMAKAFYDAIQVVDEVTRPADEKPESD